MKVKILQMFHDKVNYNKVYLVGETVTFDNERAEALIARGLVENAEEVFAPIEESAVIPNEDIPSENVPTEDNNEENPSEDTPKVEEQPEELPKVVKPVATKRKAQPKDN